MLSTVRQGAAWVFFGAGHLVSCLPRYPYRLYNWLMSASSAIQGPTARGPWSRMVSHD
jgi:hypothetical protein